MQSLLVPARLASDQYKETNAVFTRTSPSSIGPVQGDKSSLYSYQPIQRRTSTRRPMQSLLVPARLASDQYKETNPAFTRTSPSSIGPVQGDQCSLYSYQPIQRRTSTRRPIQSILVPARLASDQYKATNAVFTRTSPSSIGPEQGDQSSLYSYQPIQHRTSTRRPIQSILVPAHLASDQYKETNAVFNCTSPSSIGTVQGDQSILYLYQPISHRTSTRRPIQSILVPAHLASDQYKETNAVFACTSPSSIGPVQGDQCSLYSYQPVKYSKFVV